MSAHFPDKRQSGRTLRMLQKAESLSQAGVKVCVIMSNQSMVTLARKMADQHRLGLFSVSLRSYSEVCPFMWGSMRPRKETSPETTYLVDHYVIEREFSPVLMEWCEYDLPKDFSQACPPNFFTEVGQQFRKLLAENATVDRIMRSSGSLKAVIVHLAAELRSCRLELDKLRLICPKRVKDAEGREYIYRCPAEMVPVELDLKEEGGAEVHPVIERVMTEAATGQPAPGKTETLAKSLKRACKAVTRKGKKKGARS